MNWREGKFYKALLVALCLCLLFGVSQVQRSLNGDRTTLGLTRVASLENAPPVLAFTTIALGGFRGLIANVLWIRMNDLQENDKFFEMVQLADWITKLEPHFTQVWLIQGWNMAYNISVKFKAPEDRWRWVQRGIALLRDDGLRFNPDATLIYRELSWFFQHKMGHNLDDAHMHYKEQWFLEMDPLLGKRPDFDALIHPQTPEAQEKARILRTRYKMDPQIMKELDEMYGPLEWRLPDAHAIYWADVGRRRGVKEDQERLQRSIYQTMQSSFRRGAIYENFDGSFTLGPNLDNVDKVNFAYEELMKGPDPEHRDQPLVGHRNFLRDAIYFLYLYNRQADANRWFNYLNQKYPTAMSDFVRQRRPDAPPDTRLSLEDYVLLRVTEDVKETDVDRIVAIVGGMLQQSFLELLQEDEELAEHHAVLAEKIWRRFQKGIEGAKHRIAPPTLPEIRERVLNALLDPENGLPSEAAARLRSELGLPATGPIRLQSK